MAGDTPITAEERRKKKNRAVKKEIKRLAALFYDIDENRRAFVAEQVRNMAWYTVSVKELQERIDEAGTLIPYDNGGGQSGIKENPDVKIMLGYQKNLTDISRQLAALVPPTQRKSRLAEMMAGGLDE